MMTSDEEKLHSQGARHAYCSILAICLNELDDHQKKSFSWVIERRAIIEALRDLCGEFGDNDWPDERHLGDVIEKHLGRHLRHSGE